MQTLFVAWYNFARKYETLKGQSPAMASGLSVAPAENQHAHENHRLGNGGRTEISA
jgi:hypothetical protein